MVTTYQTASRRAVCVPSVDRRPAKDCRVHMLDEQRLPEPQSRRRQWHSFLAVRTLGLPEQIGCFVSCSTVSRKHRIALTVTTAVQGRACVESDRQAGRQEEEHQQKVYEAQHTVSQRRATPRVPEVDDRNNKAVAEAGSKRGPRQQHNLIETSCILHMQRSSFCRRYDAVMLQ
jgi:hypothetical protein